MKKFILSILCVSVFFIGVGSIVEKTSAKFKSDEKALDIIKKARIAIGGDSNLAGVQSMSIVGSTTHFFEKEGIQTTKQGGLEINMQLPNQFSKAVKIGNPANAADGDAQIHKEVEVFVKKQGDSDVNWKSENGATKEGVFIVKKNEDGKVEWKSNSDGKVKVEGDKIIVTKDDGTTEEINIDGKQKILIRKDANGNLVTENIEGSGENKFIFRSDDGKVVTEDIENIDGKNVVILKNKDGNVITENIVGPHKMKFRAEGGMRQNEMLRTTMALLMSAPEGQDVSYKFAGMGNVDGNTSNIIEVSASGSSFKLFIDASTNLPQMISYQGHQNVFFINKEGSKDLSKDELIAMKEKMRDRQTVEHQIRFSDFRSVGGLLMPHRWAESVNGKQSQIIDITNIEINPANIADKFSNQKVFVRKMKPSSNK